jgi:hypothetical protein
MDSGIDPKIVSDRVGHSNMAVTLQIYTHRSSGRDRDAAERIGRWIERTVHGDEASSGAGNAENVKITPTIRSPDKDRHL